MKNQRIVFTKINTAELLEVPMPEVQEDSILVKTAYTAISAGTERANITGDPNVSICCDGEVVFPRCCGYSSCGQVIKTGEKVTDVKTGDWVVMSWTSHSTYNEVRKENYVKVPDGVSLKEAAFCHIGTFPLAALRKVRLEIGESVLVMGAGILGVMAVAFAKAAGAVPVIVADPVKERREKALQMGADYALDPLEEGFAEKVKELSIKLSAIENAAIRLAANIKKTQKRANALKNITIPKYEALTKDIQNALEEKEREEFTRLKVIKRMKQNSSDNFSLKV